MGGVFRSRPVGLGQRACEQATLPRAKRIFRTDKDDKNVLIHENTCDLPIPSNNQHDGATYPRTQHCKRPTSNLKLSANTVRPLAFVASRKSARDKEMDQRTGIFPLEIDSHKTSMCRRQAEPASPHPLRCRKAHRADSSLSMCHLLSKKHEVGKRSNGTRSHDEQCQTSPVQPNCRQKQQTVQMTFKPIKMGAQIKRSVLTKL